MFIDLQGNRINLDRVLSYKPVGDLVILFNTCHPAFDVIEFRFPTVEDRNNTLHWIDYRSAAKHCPKDWKAKNNPAFNCQY